jgi:hypothetical protein
MIQRLRQLGVVRRDNAGTGDRPRGRDGWLVRVGFTLCETCLASGMKDAASERPIIDRAAVHQAGKAGADLPPFPVDLIPEQGADRAELGLDRLVVELRGVQARHERGRAELMARKMYGNAGHACGAAASSERGGRRANANKGQCEPPVFLQENHPLHPSVLRGRWDRRHHALPSVGAATQHASVTCKQEER